MKRKAGKIFLVGAGPGDAGLITVRGAEVLKKADAVVVDALVNPSLFRSLHIPIYDVGKRGPGAVGASHSFAQADINRLLVRLGKQGKTVVRLKGGDPFVFGRGSEEVEALVAAGLRFEIVPGVSSVNGVPAYAGIPITDRRYASQVTLLTGHEATDSKATTPGVDWKKLSPQGTLVILMGVSGWPQTRRRLLAAGWPASKPVAAIEAGTTSRQRVIRTSLDVSADVFKERRLIAPATIVVGDVVRVGANLAWLEREKPLLGKKIAVTRPLDQSGELTAKLEQLGADVLSTPSIKIKPLGAKAQPRSLAHYDWIVFLSVNAVETFSKIVKDRAGGSVLCVGEQSKWAAQSLGWRVTKVPSSFNSDGVLSALGRVRGKSILLPRAQNAPKDLVHRLEKKGARVTEVSTYETVRATLTPAMRRAVLEGVQAVTFTSASTAHHFLAQFTAAERRKIFRTAAALSMGPQTTAALRSGGVTNIREARNATLDQLIEVISQ